VRNDNENPINPIDPNDGPLSHVDKLKACALLTAALFEGVSVLEKILAENGVITNAMDDPKDQLWQLGKLLVKLIHQLEGQESQQSPKENVEKPEAVTPNTNFAAEAGESPSQDEVNAEIARIERLSKMAS
jgi:hypothetical protein